MFYMHHIQDWRKGVERACDICHKLSHESEMQAWPVIPSEDWDFSIKRPMLELCASCSSQWDWAVNPGGVKVPVLQAAHDRVEEFWDVINIKRIEKIRYMQFLEGTIRISAIGSERLANKYYSIVFLDGNTRKLLALLPLNQFSKEEAIKFAKDYAKREGLEEIK